MSPPYLNMRNDARQHPMMLTRNVAQGNSVSTILYTENLRTAPMAPPAATAAKGSMALMFTVRNRTVRYTYCGSKMSSREDCFFYETIEIIIISYGVIGYL